jgi:hypothetical protein
MTTPGAPIAHQGAALVYVAFMPDNTNTKVTVHRRGPVIAIVAEPGWTEDEWDTAVPTDLATSYLGQWNYRVVDGRECWSIDTKELNRIEP